MMRQSGSYQTNSPQQFKLKALHWANGFGHAVCFDHNQYPSYPNPSFDCLIGAGALSTLQCNVGSAFEQLKAFQHQTQDWLFGFLGYDLKNEIEHLTSVLPDGTSFPDLYFFQPEHLITIHIDSCIVIESSSISPSEIFGQIESTEIFEPRHSPITMQARISKERYLQTVQTLREHIAAGDVYEINFCQEYFAEGADINPLAVFEKLNQLSKAPFSCYLKFDDKYLLSASPERFLQKKGNTITSMPIKGTIRRDSNTDKDEALKTELRNSIKEQAENVMIVDLVRNDLTRSCIPGTIKVQELFQVYTFPKVHHLVSTVSGTLKPVVNGIDAIRNAFPMGSMTGAPKVRVMQLTEQYEQTKRGIYSGAAGYFAPNGDFDFNVVIRSLIYNHTSQYLSYHVGGAITWDSVPEQEYEECLLKATAIEEILKG
jgi:para-aminobenzoate synthetase component 1